MTAIRIVLATSLALACAGRAAAQHQGHEHPADAEPVMDLGRLGRVDFANSGSAAAQPAFQRGIALLHSFLFREARAAFREAQRVDPRFAMAYWGEVLAAQDSAASDSVMRRMGPTPAARLAMAGTPRERAYLEMNERFALLPEAAYDTVGPHLVDAWRVLHESYPEDDDATLYYALSLIDQRSDLQDDADASLRASVQAAGLAEEVFSRRPDHPGAAHYLIHAYDDSRLAPLGLRAARAYAAIAPAAHHAVHMPSHIFFQFGRWPDVVAANERGWALSKTRTTGAALPPGEWDYHAADWLHYALLQQGRLRQARALTDSIRAAWTPERLAAVPAQRRRFLQSRGPELEARVALETGRQDLGEPSTATPLDAEMLAAGRAAAARGDTVLAERLVRRSERIADSVARANPGRPARTPIILRQLRALGALARHDTASALEALRVAADTVEARASLFLAEGPQRANAGTTRAMLGELLLAHGQYVEALAAFDRALELSPGRSVILLARARTLARLGRTEDARRAYARVLENWEHADDDFPGLAEARAGAGT